MPSDDRYLAYMGLAPKRIPHWEHWSCPDAETYLTGEIIGQPVQAKRGQIAHAVGEWVAFGVQHPAGISWPVSPSHT